MYLDNPKVYGDTYITDGLVSELKGFGHFKRISTWGCISQKLSGTPFSSQLTWQALHPNVTPEVCEVQLLVQLVCSTVRWKVLVCCKVCECVLKGWSDPPLPPSRLTRRTSPHTCHRKHPQHWQHSTPDPHFKTLETLNNPQFPQNTTRTVVTKHIIRQGTAAGGWGHFDNGARDAVD